LIVGGGDVSGEIGDSGAEAGETLLGVGGVAIKEELVATVGAEEFSGFAGASRGFGGFGDAVGIEEEESVALQRDRRLLVGLTVEDAQGEGAGLI